MLTWKVCWSIPAPSALWGPVASGCGWTLVTKKGVLQSSSWWGMSCVRLRVADTMPRSFHWVTGLHLDCFVWEQTACTKQPAKFPSTLCPFKAFLFFLTASHAPRQDRVAVLKSMRHLPFLSHLARLWIGTAPQLRFYAYGDLLLDHESKCHFGSSWLEKGQGAGKSLMPEPADNSWTQEILEDRGSHHLLKRRAEPQSKVRYLGGELLHKRVLIQRNVPRVLCATPISKKIRICAKYSSQVQQVGS